MRFGIREVCDVTLNKISGNGPESVHIDTAKMTTLEGASTTVYAQGGKGNSRLIAWEGEKTLTFTVEDALITMDSFHALTGTIATNTNSGVKFTATTTSFAGYYSITADTLFRDEDGRDYPAIITIPRAKLQTSLNLSLAPTGDPSTFTFTFDALPNAQEELFAIEVQNVSYTGADNAAAKTIVMYNRESYAVTGDNPQLNIATTGAVTLTDGVNTETITTLVEGDTFTNMDVGTDFGEDANIPLIKGSTSTWFVI